MPLELRPDGLQIEQEPGFHKRWWKAKRVVWIIWLLILGASMAGLLGDGPLSQKQQSSEKGSFMVDFHRITRHQRPIELRVLLSAGSTGEEFALKLNRSYMTAVEVIDIEPRPDKERAVGHYFEYTFLRKDPAEVTEVVFHIETRDAGRAIIEVELDDKDKLVLKQFIYP